MYESVCVQVCMKLPRAGSPQHGQCVLEHAALRGLLAQRPTACLPQRRWRRRRADARALQLRVARGGRGRAAGVRGARGAVPGGDDHRPGVAAARPGGLPLRPGPAVPGHRCARCRSRRRRRHSRRARRQRAAAVGLSVRAAPRTDVDLVQRGAILRHVGRKLDLYGESELERARIDALLDLLQELRTATEALAKPGGLLPTSCADYAAGQLAAGGGLPGSAASGVVALEVLVRQLPAGQYYAPSGISIADLGLFDVVDVHLPIFPRAMAAFPNLLALYARVKRKPGVVQYLAGSFGHRCAGSPP